MLGNGTGTCASDFFTASVWITPVCCYVIMGGGGQPQRQRVFFHWSAADRKALQKMCLTGVQTLMSRVAGTRGYFRPPTEALGGREKIRASGSSSQMTHPLPKSHGGGPSLQRLSGSPAQKRMKGINEVASENAVPPATSLKAHLHLFHPHTELNEASHGLHTTQNTCLYPSGHRCRCNKVSISGMWT